MNVPILWVPTGETTTRLPAAKSPSSVEILFANPNGHGTNSPNGTRFTLSYRLLGIVAHTPGGAPLNSAAPRPVYGPRCRAARAPSRSVPGCPHSRATRRLRSSTAAPGHAFAARGAG